MAISKPEAKQLLERLIFDSERPQDWIQDVWGMSPTLGETAAQLWEVFELLIECCPEEQLDNLWQTLYQDLIED
jgi:predicted 3-demethylubiquinone-9 3-methyltransferase (glyoxalase superfamily)